MHSRRSAIAGLTWRVSSSPNSWILSARHSSQCIVIDKTQHPCEGYGELKEDWQIRRHVANLVQRVGRHKAVYGYYVLDEPGSQYYPELAVWVESYRTFAPQAVAYINLFGDHATPQQMGVATYAEYVDSYVQMVRPAFLSYDHYSMMADGTVRSGYFRNLEVMRAAGLRHNLPFWNIVLGNAHYDYAAPTDAGLRFQLYTTLAYGRGASADFTYFTPNIGNYRLGPIDQFGEKTSRCRRSAMNPKLPGFGALPRMCVVEVEGEDAPPISCSRAAEPGMVVRTQTPRLRQVRKTNLELIFSDHNAYCLPPCQNKCPSHIDIPGFLKANTEGSFIESTRIFKRTIPFPSVLGRVLSGPVRRALSPGRGRGGDRHPRQPPLRGRPGAQVPGRGHEGTRAVRGAAGQRQAGRGHRLRPRGHGGRLLPRHRGPRGHRVRA